MKIIGIGDLHGKDCWKDIDPAKYDKMVFVGDYADAPDKSHEQIIQNLEAIIDLKLKLPDKVILLLGNHDIHYVDFPKHKGSGFNEEIQPILTSLFIKNNDHFSIAWQHKNYLFTHAGISRKYLAWLRDRLSETDFFANDLPLADQLNAIYKSPHKELLYVCGTRRGGFYPHGGLIWADDSETQMDHLDGFHQVAGHNRVNKIETYSRRWLKDVTSSITYIDVLQQRVEFFELNID